jgi:hypothetical protein
MPKTATRTKTDHEAPERSATEKINLGDLFLMVGFGAGRGDSFGLGREGRDWV